MSKTIIAIIIIIIVAGLGYWIYQSTLTPKEETKEEVKDEDSILLEDLKQETGIDFSAIESTEFKWVVEVDPKVQEVDIQGKGFEAKRISSAKYDSIASLLLDKGFEVDLYNIADGTFVGLIGYKKDYIVCTVSGGATGYKEATGQWISPEPDIKDVEVKCGRLELERIIDEK